MPTYDAYGRKTENLGTCSRCGAAIKYIYIHDGQIYGSECIEKVTGIGKDDQVFHGQELDYTASLKRKQDREQKFEEAKHRAQELETRRTNIRQKNQSRYEELINVLNSASRYNGDFCSQMAANIQNDGFSTILYDGILSHNQYNIVRDIWGKTVGGRRNSKAYKAAVAEFDTKFDEE